MKKDKIIKLVLVSILVLAVSTIFSVLAFIGPMIVSVVMATIIGRPKYGLNKSLVSKVYLFGLGIAGIILSQFIILSVSWLTLTLNLLTFSVLFIIVLLPNKRRLAVK